MTEFSSVGDLRCSGSVLSNFHCVWTLTNFSNYDSTFKKCYKSNFSHCMKESELKYFLIICPGGFVLDYQGFVACYIYFPCPTEYKKNGITVSLTMSLCNTDGDVLVSKETKEELLTDLCKGFGYRNLIEREELLKKLKDDTLLICVEGLYSMSTITKNDSTECFSDISPYEITSKEFSPKKGNYDAHICVENVDLPVDTSVLSACSTVFAAMFKHDTKEKETRRVEVKDFDLETIESMSNFIHTGRVKLLNYKPALELLRAADKYDLRGLKTVCSLFLISQIDDKNYMEILVGAEKFNAPTLQSEAIKYICKNLSDIDFDKQCSLLEHPKLLLNIIKAIQNK